MSLLAAAAITVGWYATQGDDTVALDGENAAEDLANRCADLSLSDASATIAALREAAARDTENGLVITPSDAAGQLSEATGPAVDCIRSARITFQSADGQRWTLDGSVIDRFVTADEEQAAGFFRVVGGGIIEATRDFIDAVRNPDNQQ